MFGDLEAIPTDGISEKCLNHSMDLALSAFHGRSWSLQMLDATSKWQSGLMEGNIFELGNYDECIDIEVNDKWGSFMGQHCVTLFRLRNRALKGIMGDTDTLPLFWSVCTPSSCTPEDLQYGLSKISKSFVVNPLLCHTKESSRPLETIDWITIALLLVIGLLCLLSTTYDILMKNKERRNKNYLIFSWKTNGKSLFKTEGGKDTLHALHGMRFISMCMIVYGHTLAATMGTPAINIVSYMDSGRKWQYLYVGNLTFAVDTFFVMSGMLLSYFAMQTMRGDRRFDFLKFYLHRFIRLTPLLGLAVLIHASIIDKFGSGPIWDFAYGRTEKKYCVDNWWSTMLHVQNYVNLREACITPSWYLAVDTQLFVLSPIFLLSLRRWPKFGLGLTIATTIAGMVSAFVESYTRKDSPNYVKIGTGGQFGYSYFHTHTRAASWFVGFLLGYVMYLTIDWRAKVSVGTARLSKFFVTSAWLLTIIAASLVYCSLHPFLQKDYVYNATEIGFYYALARPVFCVCISWIIFACVTGYGGVVNTVLSWPGWRPLARLTFAMYLFHFDFIFARIASMKTTTYQTHYSKFAEFVQNLVLTTLLAVVMTLSVESPVMQLEKLMFSRGSRGTSRISGNLPRHLSDDILRANGKNERSD